jgi:hypothetical protein
MRRPLDYQITGDHLGRMHLRFRNFEGVPLALQITLLPVYRAQ